MAKLRKWTEAQLRKAAKDSTSYRQVLGKLKLRPTGGNYTQLRKYLSEYNIDTSHFKGRAWNKGLHGVQPSQVVLEEILVQNGRQIQTYKLKRILLRRGLKHPRCELCGWAEIAPGGYAPVELDHINGNPRDNRLQNLRILCPNCHSLTPTYRSRKRKVTI